MLKNVALLGEKYKIRNDVYTYKDPANNVDKLTIVVYLNSPQYVTELLLPRDSHRNQRY